MIKIYCYSKCSTCQKALKWLDSKNLQYESIDIKTQNPDKETLYTLWQKSGMDLKRFFNTSGVLYKEAGLSKKLPTLTDDEKLDLLASDGMLVKRPLLICDNTVITGFKENEWEEALSNLS